MQINLLLLTQERELILIQILSTKFSKNITQDSCYIRPFRTIFGVQI